MISRTVASERFICRHTFVRWGLPNMQMRLPLCRIHPCVRCCTQVSDTNKFTLVLGRWVPIETILEAEEGAAQLPIAQVWGVLLHW